MAEKLALGGPCCGSRGVCGSGPLFWGQRTEEAEKRGIREGVWDLRSEWCWPSPSRGCVTGELRSVNKTISAVGEAVRGTESWGRAAWVTCPKRARWEEPFAGQGRGGAEQGELWQDEAAQTAGWWRCAVSITVLRRLHRMEMISTPGSEEKSERWTCLICVRTADSCTTWGLGVLTSPPPRTRKSSRNFDSPELSCWQLPIDQKPYR